MSTSTLDRVDLDSSVDTLEAMWNQEEKSCEVKGCDNPAKYKVKWSECKCGNRQLLYCATCLFQFRKFSFRRGVYYVGRCDRCSGVVVPVVVTPV